VLISGWGLAGEGLGKISKSRGGGPLAPMEMIERYSADAVRYWAASTGPGKDATISEEKIQLGAKLVTKLWNISRFSERFLESMPSAPSLTELSGWLTPADRWILSRTQRLLRRVTDLLESYEYANAKSEIETFFWTELADNYLEMAKQRLYEEAHPQREAARATLYHSLLTMLKLLAPYLPFVTEEVYLNLFTRWEPSGSIHNARWPEPLPDFEDDQAEGLGEALIRIATVVRRFKSENNLPLSAPLKRLQLATNQSELRQGLNAAGPDLKSITRTGQVEVVSQLDAQLHILEMEGPVGVALEMPEVEREQREEQKGGT
jgi:valyl-tRNA synthetase